MKVRQYLIINDSESDANELTEQLGKFPFFHRVGIVPTIEGAIEQLTSRSVDLIFMDISSRNQSGLTLLRSGMALPPVIITSAYPEYAIDSYEIGKAVDYLLKPFSPERLHIAVTRALQLQVNFSSIVDVDGVFLKMGRRIQRFDFKNIDYIEAFGIYSKLYANEQMFLINERISSMDQLLPSRWFMRIHKSYIINVSKISSYDRHNLWVNHTKIPIGISFRPRLESILALFDNSEELSE
jgi:DNA-binding LytR/AlgR family response regulator